MVKVDLKYNPYMMETTVKFNSREPFTNIHIWNVIIYNGYPRTVQTTSIMLLHFVLIVIGKCIVLQMKMT